MQLPHYGLPATWQVATADGLPRGFSAGGCGVCHRARATSSMPTRSLHCTFGGDDCLAKRQPVAVLALRELLFAHGALRKEENVADPWTASREPTSGTPIANGYQVFERLLRRT